MTPTTTDFRAKRGCGDANVPSVLEKTMRDKGGKRKWPHFLEILAHSRSLHQSTCIAEPQRMTSFFDKGHVTMDSTAQEGFDIIWDNMFSLDDRVGIPDDRVGIPDAVYPLMWSFLLESTSGMAPFLDFKSIKSLMLVNKTSKSAFDDYWGWRVCAQALKQEAEDKRLLVDRFQDRVRDVHSFYRNNPSYRKEIKRARKRNSRILSIQSDLLPEANRLAVLHGSKEVSMDHYESIGYLIEDVKYCMSKFRKLDRRRERRVLLEQVLLERALRERSRVATSVTTSPNSSWLSWIVGLFYA